MASDSNVFWTVLNKDNTHALRRGWRWAWEGGNRAAIWVALSEMTEDASPVLYECEENADRSASVVGGVVARVRGERPVPQ
jgi:hypothetical protein